MEALTHRIAAKLWSAAWPVEFLFRRISRMAVTTRSSMRNGSRNTRTLTVTQKNDVESSSCCKHQT